MLDYFLRQYSLIFLLVYGAGSEFRSIYNTVLDDPPTLMLSPVIHFSPANHILAPVHILIGEDSLDPLSLNLVEKMS